MHMTTIEDNSTPVVVINALHQGGLGITRTLGRLGVPVYSVAPDGFAPSLSSRYCHKRLIWNIENVSADESVKYLLGVAQSIGRRPLLIVRYH